MMSSMSTVDRWSDWSSEGNEEYMTVEFVVVDGDKIERVDIKHKEDGFTYVMDCHNGYPVYEEGSEDGYRELTTEEYEELIEFADEQFEVEAKLNAKQ